MAKTLLDMEEEQLAKEISWAIVGVKDGHKRVAAVIRKMIENALIEAGVKSDD